MNVQENWQKDAREWIYDAMFRAMFVMTYRVIQEVRRLGSDCFRFRGLPARELCEDFALKMPPNKNLISHFFTLFSVLVWPFLQCIGRVLAMPHLFVYKGMNLGQNLGLNP